MYVWIYRMVQWLRLCPSKAETADSIPGQESQDPHITQCNQKKKKIHDYKIIIIFIKINNISFSEAFVASK